MINYPTSFKMNYIKQYSKKFHEIEIGYKTYTEISLLLP